MSAMVNALWVRMTALYGHRWASQYGETATGAVAKTWEAAIGGLSPDQLATGLAECITEGAEFPPSAPRFRTMCLDVPSFDRIKREASLPADERGEFIRRRVWPYLDLYSYRNSSMVAAEKLLRSAYDLAVEDLARGVPLPAAALEPPVVRATFGSGLHPCGYSQLDNTPAARAARERWFAENVESPFNE